MPYADPEKRRECRLQCQRRYREKKKADAEYKAAEAARKAAWLQTPEGKASNAAASRFSRYKKRLRKKAQKM